MKDTKASDQTWDKFQSLQRTCLMLRQNKAHRRRPSDRRGHAAAWPASSRAVGGAERCNHQPTSGVWCRDWLLLAATSKCIKDFGWTSQVGDLETSLSNHTQLNIYWSLFTPARLISIKMIQLNLCLLIYMLNQLLT